jgi:hypothetical protein
MPELHPSNYWGNYLTMASGMGQNIDRLARLGQYMQDQPYVRAQQAAQTQGQQLQNYYVPLTMQNATYGSPFEQQKFAQAAQQQALQQQMQQLQFNRQQTLAENTLRQTANADKRATDLAILNATKPIFDADSGTWQYPPGGSRMPQGGVNPPFNPSGPNVAPSVGDQPPVLLSHKRQEFARQLRNDLMAQTKPLNELESDISQARQLLKTGTPLAHQMLNEKLISLLDPNRTSTKLFEGNRNFGDLTERLVGKVGKFFTGKYTEEQQKEIQDTIDEMAKNVVSPAKQRIGDYYKGMAKQSNIPESQLDVPDFYGAKEQTNSGWSVKRIK